LEWEFESPTDKALQIIICLGITGGVFLYTIFDSVRFLPSLFDKFLCVLSCLMLKPILLPVLMPGSYFISPIAVRRPGKYVH
jgi:hypothetical protein